MASFNLSPIGNGFQFFTSGGLPLNGGLLYTYAAGTSTPQATYTTPQGTIANANPMVMNSDGRLPNEVWLNSGISYKFVLNDSLGSLIATYDNLVGVNDITNTVTEWVAPGFIPTYINTTSFSVTGNQTATYQVNRRIQASVSGGLIYGTVTASSYASSITTVTLSMDSTLLDNTLTAVNISFLSATNLSVPVLLRVINSTASTQQPVPRAQADTLYAALAGLATQLFSVAPATSANNAVNLGQFVVSLAATGYAKFPGGLILQWGGPVTVPASGGGVVVTFPIAFPTAFFNAFVSVSGAAAQMLGWSGSSVNGLTISTGAADANSRSAYWFAIGY